MASHGKLRRRLRRKAPPVRRLPDPGTKATRDKAAEGGLMVGGAKDPAEQTADHMAARVLAGGSAPATPARGGGAVQRSAAAPVVASGAAAARAPASAARDVAAMGPGQPLSRAERGWFEPRFGADLSGVRVHEDAAADRAAGALGARAFAAGQDVAFAQGQRTPQVMAHELAHVVQDGGTALRRDLALEPANPGAVATVLTDRQRAEAQKFNERRFEDPFTIAVIRDVMGIAKYPARIDNDFIDALVGWQAERDLTQDGQFGPATTTTFLDELMAEGMVDLANQLRDDNSVSVRTTNGPFLGQPTAATPANGPVQALQWDVAFGTSLRSGFIVQHIQGRFNQNPAPPAGGMPAVVNFWESWAVDARGNVTPANGGTNDFWQFNLTNGRRGNWNVRGTLYTVLNLPAQFQGPGGANHAVFSGQLRSALNLTAANIDALGLPEGMLPIQQGDEGARRIGGTFDFAVPLAQQFHNRT